MLKLVVGLGNPGDRYFRTRHNIGFRLADRLAEDVRWERFESGETAKVDGLWLAKPMTYMNESGRFVRAFAAYHRVEPSELLVCFDDVALPFGRLRLRKKGSSGGQKGMESIIAAFGTEDIPRLRIGVGPQPPGVDSAHFVLKPFSKQDEAGLPEVLDAAAGAVRVVREDGLDAAMNRYNPAV